MIWILIAIAVMIVIIIAGAWEAMRVLRDDEPALIGIELDPQPAPDFQLTDHRGQPVDLSDFRGRAVALTFISTDCPDVCPLTAMNMGEAHDMVPEELRDDVAFLAVTVDPARDTRAALREFSARFDLADTPGWFALRGDITELEAVWRHYGIDPGAELATPGQEHGGHAGEPDGGNGHPEAIYLIDPQGQERIFMRSTADPEALANNLVALLQ